MATAASRFTSRRSRKKYRPMKKSVRPAAERTQGACQPVTRAYSHRRRHGQGGRRAAGHEAEAHQEQEERRQRRHVGAGDDDRVNRARAAELLRPHLFELEGLADEDGLHHAGFIRLTAVELLQPLQRRHPQSHNGAPKRRAARARQRPDGSSAGGRGGPIDVLPRQVAGVVERAGVVVVLRPANLRVHFDELPVAETRRRLALPQIDGDLRTGVALQVENEALAPIGERGRFHHAAGDGHGAFGVQFRRRTRAPRHIAQRSGPYQAGQAGATGDAPRAPPQGRHAKRQQRARGGDQLAGFERDEAR